MSGWRGISVGQQTEEEGQDMGQKDSPAGQKYNPAGQMGIGPDSWPKPEGAPGWVREELLRRAADPQDMGQPLLSTGPKDIPVGQDSATDPQDMANDDKAWGPYRDKAAAGHETVSFAASELAAFMAVVQDRPKDAKDIVSRMSRRDRALLSFYLRELGNVVDAQDMKDAP